MRGREFYVVARVGDMRLDYGLKPIRPGEIAGIVAKELDHAARRYTLPIPLEANDKAVERLRDYLNRMHQVNRALAGIAFREALDEIVTLRTALALGKGQRDSS